MSLKLKYHLKICSLKSRRLCLSLTFPSYLYYIHYKNHALALNLIYKRHKFSENRSDVNNKNIMHHFRCKEVIERVTECVYLQLKYLYLSLSFECPVFLVSSMRNAFGCWPSQTCPRSRGPTYHVYLSICLKVLLCLFVSRIAFRGRRSHCQVTYPN